MKTFQEYLEMAAKKAPAKKTPGINSLPENEEWNDNHSEFWHLIASGYRGEDAFENSSMTSDDLDYSSPFYSTNYDGEWEEFWNDPSQRGPMVQEAIYATSILLRNTPWAKIIDKEYPLISKQFYQEVIQAISKFDKGPNLQKSVNRIAKYLKSGI